MADDKVRDILTEGQVDYDRTLERFASNLGLYMKFLNKFLSDPNYTDLQAAVKDKNYEQMLTSVHTLKGVTGNLGLTKLYDICSDMTQDLRNEKYDDALALSRDLEKEYIRITGVINTVMGVYHA